MESDRTNEVMASEVPHVAISVRDETRPADPQSTGYYVVIYFISYIMVVILCFARHIIHNKSQSPFKAHGGLFMFMAIAAVSMAVLASGFFNICELLLATLDEEYPLHRLEKRWDLLWTSCTLLPNSCHIPVPRNFNSCVYIVISITTVLFLAAYYFIWKHLCRYQHKLVYETVPWSSYLSVLPGLLIASVIDELVNHRDWVGLHVVDNSCFHYRTDDYAVEDDEYEEKLKKESIAFFFLATYGVVSRQIMLLDFINGLPREKREVNGLKIFNTECLDLIAKVVDDKLVEQGRLISLHIQFHLNKSIASLSGWSFAFASLCAKHLVPVGLGDDDQCIEDDFTAWKELVWPELDQLLHDEDDTSVATPYTDDVAEYFQSAT
ncbi:cytochrome P450 reductase [Tanacetum coccineum]